MRRDERRTRLTNAPVAGLILLGAVSIGAWLWIALTDVEINARIQGPVEASLLAVAAIGIYLLWLAIPVAAATWLVFRLQDPSRQGPYARRGITAAGIIAAIIGVYCAFLTAGAIWDFILLVRALSGLAEGQAGIPILIAGFISFVFVVVLGSATGLLMLIAAWGLEPRRRWRQWRIPGRTAR
jgi:amino acid transporter